MASHDVFHRHGYAHDMAEQLLQPSSLQLQVRSGVFLSGIRRIGKTTFLRQDLIPTLEAMGALARIFHGSPCRRLVCHVDA